MTKSRRHRARVVALGASLLLFLGAPMGAVAQRTGPPPTAEAPFELINNVIVLTVRIDGREAPAVLDNRVESSLVDLDYAQRSGMALGPSLGMVQTPTARLERRLAPDVAVAIPGQEERRGPLSVVDLSFMRQALGRPVAMIVGRDAFQRGGVAVLSSRRRLLFGVERSGRIASLPFAPLRNDRPQVEATVDGRPLLLTIDLGHNGGLRLSPSAWARLGLDRGPVSRRQSATLAGDIQSFAHTVLPEVRVGPFAAARVEAGLGGVFPEDGDGVLGLSFLSQFDFVIDQPGGRLILIRRSTR